MSCDTDTEETRARGMVKSEVGLPCFGSETHRDSQPWPVLVVTVSGLIVSPLHNVQNIISLRKFELTGSGSKA